MFDELARTKNSKEFEKKFEKQSELVKEYDISMRIDGAALCSRLANPEASSKILEFAKKAWTPSLPPGAVPRLSLGMMIELPLANQNHVENVARLLEEVPADAPRQGKMQKLWQGTKDKAKVLKDGVFGLPWGKMLSHTMHAFACLTFFSSLIAPTRSLHWHEMGALVCGFSASALQLAGSVLKRLMAKCTSAVSQAVTAFLCNTSKLQGGAFKTYASF